MIFDAKQIAEDLGRLLNRATCPFRVSQGCLDKFKKCCQKLGFKNHSAVLEALLVSFTLYAENRKNVALQVTGHSDRVQTSFSCSEKVWEDFNSTVKEQGLDRIQVIEFLMDEFCRQLGR